MAGDVGPAKFGDLGRLRAGGVTYRAGARFADIERDGHQFGQQRHLLPVRQALDPGDRPKAGGLVGLATRLKSGPHLTVERDLLAHIVAKSGGRPRRICVNLEKVQTFADVEGLDAVGVKAWGDRPLFTGAAPARRAA